MDTETTIRLGHAAREILANEAVEEAFETLRTILRDQIENYPTDDVDNIMAIQRQLRALRQLRGRLETMEQVGRHESAKLNEGKK